MQWECKRFADLSPEELYRLLQLRVDVFVVEQRCPYPELDGKDPEALHVFAWDETGVQAYLRVLRPGVSFPEASLGRVATRARGSRPGSRAAAPGAESRGGLAGKGAPPHRGPDLRQRFLREVRLPAGLGGVFRGRHPPHPDAAGVSPAHEKRPGPFHKAGPLCGLLPPHRVPSPAGKAWNTWGRAFTRSVGSMARWPRRSAHRSPAYP